MLSLYGAADHRETSSDTEIRTGLRALRSGRVRAPWPRAISAMSTGAGLNSCRDACIAAKRRDTQLSMPLSARSGLLCPPHSINHEPRRGTMLGTSVFTARLGKRLAGFRGHDGVHAHERRGRRRD